MSGGRDLRRRAVRAAGPRRPGRAWWPSRGQDEPRRRRSLPHLRDATPASPTARGSAGAAAGRRATRCGAASRPCRRPAWPMRRRPRSRCRARRRRSRRARAPAGSASWWCRSTRAPWRPPPGPAPSRSRRLVSRTSSRNTPPAFAAIRAMATRAARIGAREQRLLVGRTGDSAVPETPYATRVDGAGRRRHNRGHADACAAPLPGDRVATPRRSRARSDHPGTHRHREPRATPGVVRSHEEVHTVELQIRPDRESFDTLAASWPLVPVWAELLSDVSTPVGLFPGLAADGPGVLLESVERSERWGRYSFVAGDPAAVVVGDRDGLRVTERRRELPYSIGDGSPRQGLIELARSLRAPRRARPAGAHRRADGLRRLRGRRAARRPPRARSVIGAGAADRPARRRPCSGLRPLEAAPPVGGPRAGGVLRRRGRRRA